MIFPAVNGDGTWKVPATVATVAGSVAEVDPEAAEVFGVFFEAVVLGFDVFLLEELEDAFLEDAGAFAGDDFDERDFFVHGLADDVGEGGFDLAALVEDVVEVEGEFGHGSPDVGLDGLEIGDGGKMLLVEGVEGDAVAERGGGDEGIEQAQGMRKMSESEDLQCLIA